jgi:rod shape-determining protein MreD
MSARIYLAFPVMLFLLLLQVTVSPNFELYGVTPQLLFLITIVWALYYGLQQGLIWAFVGGILIDLFSAGPMGASSLALMAAVMVIVSIQRLFPENRILVPLVLGAVASLVFWIVYLVLLRILVPFMITSLDYLSVAGVVSGSQARGLLGEITGGYGLGGSIGNLVLTSTIIHSVLILPLYWALSTADRVLRPKSVEI